MSQSEEMLYPARTSLILLFIIFMPVYSVCSGRVTADFLAVDILARETALGGIYTPNYAKPGASVINPAVLAGINGNFLIISHYSSVFGVNYEQAVAALPLAPDKYLSAFVMYDTIHGLERTDAEGKAISTIENYDFMAGSSYAFTFSRDYNIGFTLKGTASRIFNTTQFGMAVNAGLLYRNFERRYMIGAVIENVGVSSAFFKEDAQYPLIVRGGYGTEIYRDEDVYKAAFYIEERLYLNENEGTETSFGLEVFYMKFFVLRYGYIFGRDQGRIALGAGFKFDRYYIDYAYQPYFISDNAHRLTMKVKF